MRKADLGYVVAFPKLFGLAPAGISRHSNDRCPVENAVPGKISVCVCVWCADAMDCKVELVRAGMLTPETGWERSLPTSPASSHKMQQELLKQLILICQ